MTDTAVGSKAVAELPGGAGSDAPALTTSQVGATAVLNLLGLALPIVILQVYDRVIPNQTTETLMALLTGLVAVLVIDGLLRVARGYLTSWTGAQFEHRCLCSAVDTVLRADPRAIEAEKPGAHIDRINAIDQLRDFYGGQGRLLLIDLPFLFVFLALFWVIADYLVIVPLVIFSLLALATVIVAHAMRKALEERHSIDDRRYSFMIQVLSSIETVKALALERGMTRRYERLQLAGAGSTLSVIFLSGCAQTIGNISSGLTLTAVVAIGATQVIAGMLSPGELAACTLLATRAVQPVMRGLNLWTQFQNLAVAETRIEQLEALPPAADRRGSASLGRQISGEIEFKDVSFRYDDDSPYHLHEANVHIGAGEIVAIVGGDGAGKSTFLGLVAGRLQAGTGQILFDGEPESEGRFMDANQVITVNRDSALFHGTILENLTAFEGPERLEQALAAARSLGLDNEVHRLPKGYDTPVSTLAGAELSASLRQKIVIARAIAREPKILLFDEANANLDQAGESLLRQALSAQRGKMTIIMVTHRPSLRQIADRVLLLTQGRLRPFCGDEPELDDFSADAAVHFAKPTGRQSTDTRPPLTGGGTEAIPA